MAQEMDQNADKWADEEMPVLELFCDDSSPHPPTIEDHGGGKDTGEAMPELDVTMVTAPTSASWNSPMDTSLEPDDLDKVTIPSQFSPNLPNDSTSMLLSSTGKGDVDFQEAYYEEADDTDRFTPMDIGGDNSDKVSFESSQEGSKKAKNSVLIRSKYKIEISEEYSGVKKIRDVKIFVNKLPCFMCNACRVWFVTSHDLQNHDQDHHQPKPSKSQLNENWLEKGFDSNNNDVIVQGSDGKLHLAGGQNKSSGIVVRKSILKKPSRPFHIDTHHTDKQTKDGVPKIVTQSKSVAENRSGDKMGSSCQVPAVKHSAKGQDKSKGKSKDVSKLKGHDKSKVKDHNLLNAKGHDTSKKISKDASKVKGHELSKVKDHNSLNSNSQDTTKKSSKEASKVKRHDKLKVKDNNALIAKGHGASKEGSKDVSKVKTHNSLNAKCHDTSKNPSKDASKGKGNDISKVKDHHDSLKAKGHDTLKKISKDTSKVKGHDISKVKDHHDSSNAKGHATSTKCSKDASKVRGHEIPKVKDHNSLNAKSHDISKKNSKNASKEKGHDKPKVKDHHSAQNTKGHDELKKHNQVTKKTKAAADPGQHGEKSKKKKLDERSGSFNEKTAATDSNQQGEKSKGTKLKEHSENVNEKISSQEEVSAPLKLGRPKNKFYRCRFCKNRKFKQVATLKNHYKVAHKDKTYPCTMCSKTFEKKRQRLAHIAIVHDELAMLKCKHCDQRFDDRDSLDSHEKIHYADDTDLEKKCQRLAYVAVSRAELPTLKCKHCDKWFDDGDSLESHEKIHDSDDMALIGSDSSMQSPAVKPNASKPIPKLLICDITTTIFEDICDTSSESNKNQGSFKCTSCPKSFTRRSALILHLKRHGGPKDGYKCEYCKEKFLTKAERTVHRWQHISKWPYQCVYCDKKFLQQMTFRAHVTNIHINNKQPVIVLDAE